jgi:hypothetical protein
MPKNKEPYLNLKSFWRLSEAFFMGEMVIKGLFSIEGLRTLYFTPFL